MSYDWKELVKGCITMWEFTFSLVLYHVVVIITNKLGLLVVLLFVCFCCFCWFLCGFMSLDWMLMILCDQYKMTV